MRIAQIAPLCESVPPKLYGGTERIVSILTEALVGLGHEVTLFASGDSQTLAKLIPGRGCAVRLDTGLAWDLPAHLAMLEDVRQLADQFDILHFHTECLHMPVFRDLAEQTLTTLHGRLDIDDLRAFYKHFPNFPLVSISNEQRRPLAFAEFAATVYHGLPRDALAPAPSPRGDYLAFLGRICYEKRPDRAIEIAKRTRMTLKIAAKVDQADWVYFEEKIRPLLGDPQIDFIGEIGDEKKAAFLGNARALLFPIDWPEPFGLVMIEAMACGTPVIAWPCGAAPEVVNHGITGYLVDEIEAAAEAVLAAQSLNRRRIRQVFEKRFSAETMARSYVEIYERLVAGRAALPPAYAAATRPAALTAPQPALPVSAAALAGRKRPARPGKR